MIVDIYWDGNGFVVLKLDTGNLYWLVNIAAALFVAPNPTWT